MRVLIVGPDHDRGSIPPYLDVLAAALCSLGVGVDRVGSPGIPYDHTVHGFWDADRIVTEATRLLEKIDLFRYDVLSLQFGNLEIEQLLPVLWSERPHPPAVYHVHTMAPTLFRTHVPAPGLQRDVIDSLQSMDGYVYFGQYAQRRFPAPPDAPSTTTWLPSTIPPGTPATVTPALDEALATSDGRPIVSLYGFAAPWKDPATLLSALELLDHPLHVVLAGPFWDAPSQAGIEIPAGLNRIGPTGRTALSVVADYVGPSQRAALIEASDLAVFPYRNHPSFQGSGAIADYLAHGVPVVATDVANMAELVGDAGRIVRPGDPDSLATTLHQLLTQPGRQHARRAAKRRAHQFTAAHHAHRCLALYRQVTRTTQATAP